MQSKPPIQQDLQSNDLLENIRKQLLVSPYLTESMYRQLTVQEPSDKIEAMLVEPTIPETHATNSTEQIKQILQKITNPLPIDSPYIR